MLSEFIRIHSGNGPTQAPSEHTMFGLPDILNPKLQVYVASSPTTVLNPPEIAGACAGHVVILAETFTEISKVLVGF